jgi:diguanylate cyclase (GGDEF)-like protein
VSASVTHASAHPKPTFEALIGEAKAQMMSNPSAALEKATAAKKVADQASSTSGHVMKATTLWLSGEALTRMGEPQKALTAIHEAIKLLKKQDQQTKLYADLLKAEAAAYSKSGQVRKSLPLLHRAFAIYGKLGEARAQAIILHNIGAIYYDARDYNRMLGYLAQAEALYNDDNALAVALHNNRANALKELRRFDESKAEYEKALKIARATNNPLVEVNALSNIASALILENKLDDASNVLRQAERLLSGPALEQRPFIFGARAQIALNQNRLGDAAKYIELSFAGVDIKNSNMPFKEYHETAYKIYAKLGQHKLALQHLAAFKRLDDSGRELAASTNDALMTAQFDNANRQLKMSRLEAGQAKAESKLREYFVLVSAGSLMAIIIILLLVLRIAAARRRRIEMLESNAKLSYAATHDTLTGLPNRSYLANLGENINGGDAYAVMIVDLDRFKWVNDTQGHLAGDELLQAVATILHDEVGDRGEALRLGGDEFAIVISSFDGPEEIEALASSIVLKMQQSFNIHGNPTNIGATIGFALAPEDGQSLATVMRCADLALYAGKERSRNCAVRYLPSMSETVELQQVIREDLRYGIERDQLKIVYQAIVDMQSHAIIGYEALVRWDHPVLGAVSPAVFIPIAEEAGLMGNIGDWILRTACAEASRWDENLFLTVNLSAIQINAKGLITQVVNALASNNLAANRLELEVTETAFLGNNGDADQTLAQLRNLGVRLALDDFGTGYSSLSYLRRANFTTIKIDRSFVRSASEGSNDSLAIIRAIVLLATEMGMNTTAEGIETEADLTCLSKLGCTQAQGYYFAAPIDQPSRDIDNKSLAA